MDSFLITEKLESLRRCIARVEEKRVTQLDELLRDPDRQDILVLNLTRAVQLCVDIASHIISQSGQRVPTTMGETFQSLSAMGTLNAETAEQLRRAIGFRNIAVHNYDAIDWAIVLAISTKQLPIFRDFARQVSAAVGLV